MSNLGEEGESEESQGDGGEDLKNPNPKCLNLAIERGGVNYEVQSGKGNIHGNLRDITIIYL